MKKNIDITVSSTLPVIADAPPPESSGAVVPKAKKVVVVPHDPVKKSEKQLFT